MQQPANIRWSKSAQVYGEQTKIVNRHVCLYNIRGFGLNKYLL